MEVPATAGSSVYYRKTRSYLDRKMCVVLPHILARGPLRAPVQPPACGSDKASSLFRTKIRIAGSTHSRETSLSLHPSIKRAITPLWKPARMGPEDLPLHPLHPEPCTNDWSFDLHPWEPHAPLETPRLLSILILPITLKLICTRSAGVDEAAFPAKFPGPSHGQRDRLSYESKLV